MTMNAELAAFYGTNGATEEDFEKQASVENFAKLAAKHGIDLSTMDDDEVSALYAEVYPEFAKTAAENGFPPKKKDEEEDEEEKKESAAYHFQEKVAFQEKFAEADFMGRVMAHSFTQELGDIEKQGGKYTDMARKGYETAKGGLKRYGEQLTGSKAKKLKGQTESLLARAKRQATGGYARDKGTGKSLAELAGEMAGKKRGLAKSEAKKVLKARVGTAAGVGTLGAAGTFAATRDKKASAQDFEELSGNQAIKIAEAAGYDVDQAHELVQAVYTLGLEETEKVAGVQDLDDAIHVRGLEYLEAAGYDVDWDEVFGG